MIFIGLDPGLQGGMALINESEGATRIMPTIAYRKKRVLDHSTLRSILSGFDPDETYAVLEQQHPMPKQGVSSMFSIGYGFGALKQCLIDFSIPHEVVRATVWQKEFGISSRKGNTKVQALQICQDLFPNVNLLATEKSKKPHAGIVDALLIAEFSRRRYAGIASQSDRATAKTEKRLRC